MNSSPRSKTALKTPVVVKRDNRKVSFDGERIRSALRKAVRATQGISTDHPLPADLSDKMEALADEVTDWCLEKEKVGVEQIQDEVERVLMRAGEHAVARRYILYREDRARERRRPEFCYTTADGAQEPIDYTRLRRTIEAACEGLGSSVEPEIIYDETVSSLYDGIAVSEITQAAILAARTQIEKEPAYRFAAARLLLGKIYREVFAEPVSLAEVDAAYRRYFPEYIRTYVDFGRLDERLLTFDLDRLANALTAERDFDLTYHSVQTLYDRYLIKHDGRRVELPQLLWMRVAMGLAVHEAHPNDRAVEFYDILSQRYFVNSTPTLFNAGTDHPQLSSCYLLTVQDDLGNIFKTIKDNAHLSKWAGGLGNDWTNIRGMGAHIHGTNGKSQGVVPFLKIFNDTLVAVNQGGKRKGAGCAYLETWHIDIEDFLELRKNTGDERRRTPDMNSANWIPDLFMKRVINDEKWTLFSPDDVADLHDLYGREFEKRYEAYEQLAEAGNIDIHKEVSAVQLWRKMLSMLFETGHPWITFKDPSNIRSAQDHEGVVHSSNLCTEILLNTSEEETAVCNLGSVNLPKHLDANGQLDLERLQQTIQTAIRMLDNVIDINFYPTTEAERSNQRHRPIGLGVMGFQDVLYENDVSYASGSAADIADEIQEAVSYYAIEASTLLAEEFSPYSTYEGSKWDRGLLPIDTLDLLARERGQTIPVPRTTRMPWDNLRERIETHGMRNSNVMAIAPTATISNITGVTQSIEPTYKHLFAKSNLSGEFTVINEHLVEDLKAEELWDQQMIDDLKYYDGSVQPIDRIPDDLKDKYVTAFEIPPEYLIECAARRQKWIDMGQSLNLYMAQPSGRKISDMYKLAWRKGLKTTYYLRTLGATQIEKSTLDINARNIQPRWMNNSSPSSEIDVDRVSELPSCEIEDDSCEVCQ